MISVSCLQARYTKQEILHNCSKEAEYMKHDDVSSKTDFLNNIHTNFVPQS